MPSSFRAGRLAGLGLPALAAPRRARRPAARSSLGTLTPLTGAGGAYGPPMVKSVQAVVDEINAGGGVLGRKIELISEDDETNPDSALSAPPAN